MAMPGTCGNLVQAAKKSWIYVTRFAKTQHNDACWNFQYKAFIKLCAKMHFIKTMVFYRAITWLW